jgi:DNA repair exonuclease SbcCD ATPase subunit
MQKGTDNMNRNELRKKIREEANNKTKILTDKFKKDEPKITDIKENIEENPEIFEETPEVSNEDFSDKSILEKIENAMKEKEEAESKINIPSASSVNEISSEEHNSVLKENDTLKDEIQKLKQNVSKIETENDELKRKLEEAEKKDIEIEKLKNEIKKINQEKEVKVDNAELETLKEQLLKVTEENKKYKVNLEATTTRIKELSNIIAEQKEARNAMTEGNKKMLKDNRKLKEENKELLEALSSFHSKYDQEIKLYSDNIRKLTGYIREFEEAYIAIGGDLHDVYEDYDEFE